MPYFIRRTVPTFPLSQTFRSVRFSPSPIKFLQLSTLSLLIHLRFLKQLPSILRNTIRSLYFDSMQLIPALLNQSIDGIRT